MATGVTALSNTLIGVEVTAPGTSTDAPTTHWRGTGKVKTRLEKVFPPERIGKIGGTLRSYIPRTGGEATLEGTATFEQLPYIFNAGIYATVGTTDTGSGIIRTWTVQTASTDPVASTDLNTLVVEAGDNIGVRVAHYCFVREYTLTGKQGEGMTVSATLQSRAPTTSASFTAVGDTDFDNVAETILFSKVSMSIDPSTDTIGTTQKTETILDFSFKHTTGWVELPARDGRLDFSNIKHIDDEMTLDVTFEHNSIATAEYTAFTNDTERAVQLKFTGSALASAGTYTYKTFTMNLYGKWLSFGAEGLEEQDGDNVYKGVLKVALSEKAAPNKATFILVSDVVTLP